MAKKSPTQNYTLRIVEANPSTFPMDRLAEYLAEFSELLGHENAPVFSKIKKSSVGIVAAISDRRVNDVQVRILTAKSKPASRPGKALSGIYDLLAEHGYENAELLDVSSRVLHAFKVPPKIEELLAPRISMVSTVDGTVLGVMGRDETMHLQLIDHLNRDIRLLIKSESLARDLLEHFRRGVVRVMVDGVWVRKDAGWIPESGSCVVKSFDLLDSSPVSDIFHQFASVENNGWTQVNDPMGILRDLRGVH